MSLFICPNCSYSEHPIWKTAKWRRYSLYCAFSELEQAFPSLAKKLLESVDGWVFEKPYFYKLTKSKRYVYRMTKMGTDEWRSHGFTEKPKRVFMPRIEVPTP